MLQTYRSFLLRYGSAVASIALATGIGLFLDPALGHHLFLTPFFVAIMLTAWYGGLGPSRLLLHSASWRWSCSWFRPLAPLQFRGWNVRSALAFTSWSALAVHFSSNRYELPAVGPRPAPWRHSVSKRNWNRKSATANRPKKPCINSGNGGESPLVASPMP
jgi:hypothetical protein